MDLNRNGITLMTLKLKDVEDKQKFGASYGHHPHSALYVLISRKIIRWTLNVFVSGVASRKLWGSVSTHFSIYCPSLFRPFTGSILQNSQTCKNVNFCRTTKVIENKHLHFCILSMNVKLASTKSKWILLQRNILTIK